MSTQTNMLVQNMVSFLDKNRDYELKSDEVGPKTRKKFADPIGTVSANAISDSFEKAATGKFGPAAAKAATKFTEECNAAEALSTRAGDLYIDAKLTTEHQSFTPYFAAVCIGDAGAVSAIAGGIAWALAAGPAAPYFFVGGLIALGIAALIALIKAKVDADESRDLYAKAAAVITDNRPHFQKALDDFADAVPAQNPTI